MYLRVAVCTWQRREVEYPQIICIILLQLREHDSVTVGQLIGITCLRFAVCKLVCLQDIQLRTGQQHYTGKNYLVRLITKNLYVAVSIFSHINIIFM